MPLQAYLGGTKLFIENSLLGTTPVTLEGNFNPPPTFDKTNLDFWFDASTYSGTGNLLASYGNATASLFSVVKNTNNGGVLGMSDTAILEITSSGAVPNYSATTAYTVILIAANSGSVALTHDRILQGITNNWLLGTRSGNQESFYNGVFVYEVAGTYSNNFLMYAGIQHSTSSGSMYVNNSYRGGSTSATQYGFNGLAVNKGLGGGSNCQVGQILVFNTVLSPARMTEIYDYFKNTYGI